MPSIRYVSILALLAVPLSSCGPTPATSTATIQPTYDDIAAKVFASSCSTRSCHGPEGARGNLVLTPDKAYDQLVNVPADNDTAKAKGKKRVVPGDPDNSFLLQKLTGPASGEGDPMPQVGARLDPTVIAAIRTWIANGAKR